VSLPVLRKGRQAGFKPAAGLRELAMVHEAPGLLEDASEPGIPLE
jgi:hypothetical protein